MKIRYKFKTLKIQIYLKRPKQLDNKDFFRLKTIKPKILLKSNSHLATLDYLLVYQSEL